jgi:hypothetical protein
VISAHTGFSPSTSKAIVALQREDIVALQPDRHKPVPQLRKIFLKNITPKFHFGRQLSLLVVVSKASITSR